MMTSIVEGALVAIVWLDISFGFLVYLGGMEPQKRRLTRPLALRLLMIAGGLVTLACCILYWICVVIREAAKTREHVPSLSGRHMRLSFSPVGRLFEPSPTKKGS